MDYYWPFPARGQDVEKDNDLWRAQAILIRGGGLLYLTG
jgi:hypothetical protein